MCSRQYLIRIHPNNQPAPSGSSKGHSTIYLHGGELAWDSFNLSKSSSIIDWSMTVSHGSGWKLSARRVLPIGFQVKEPAQGRGLQRLLGHEMQAVRRHGLHSGTTLQSMPGSGNLALINQPVQGQEPPNSGFPGLSYITFAGVCACQLTLHSPVAEGSPTLL